MSDEELTTRERVQELLKEGTKEPEDLAKVLNKEGYTSATGNKLTPFAVKFYTRPARKNPTRTATVRKAPVSGVPSIASRHSPLVKVESATSLRRVQLILESQELGDVADRNAIALAYIDNELLT